MLNCATATRLCIVKDLSVRGDIPVMVQIGGGVVPPEPVGSKCPIDDEEQRREKGYASIGCPDNPESSRDGGRRVGRGFEAVQRSFDKFCLIVGIEALQELLQEEAVALCGEHHQRHARRRAPEPGHLSWGSGVDRPRVRSREGQQELVLPSWAAAQDEDWLGQWAMNQMLITISSLQFAARCGCRAAMSG